MILVDWTDTRLVGAIVKLAGIRMEAKVTGIDRGFVELRRIHPETAELEPGEPIVFQSQHMDVERFRWI